MRIRKILSIAMIAASLAAGAGPVWAAGPKKIKQPRSFPIVISTKGSYILTKNLDVAATGQANPENLTAISNRCSDECEQRERRTATFRNARASAS